MSGDRHPTDPHRAAQIAALGEELGGELVPRIIKAVWATMSICISTSAASLKSDPRIAFGMVAEQSDELSAGPRKIAGVDQATQRFLSNALGFCAAHESGARSSRAPASCRSPRAAVARGWRIRGARSS